MSRARIEIAEDPGATIDDVTGARDALYIQTMVNGRTRLLRWAWRGEPTAIALPFDGWVDEVHGDATRDGILFREQGWTRPAAYYAYDPTGKVVAVDALAMTTNADFANIVAEEVEAVSSDGTRVPLSILHRKDIARDSARPSIVRGYAGYSISQTPSFSPTSLAWLGENGTTQIQELGDPETEAGFRAIHAMDPYQHVVSAAYPATIFSIGLNDARVSPWMSGKMAARMQALTTSGKPILVRVDKAAGHGPGATRDQAFAERADVWSFFLAASGDPAFRVP